MPLMAPPPFGSEMDGTLMALDLVLPFSVLRKSAVPVPSFSGFIKSYFRFSLKTFFLANFYVLSFATFTKHFSSTHFIVPPRFGKVVEDFSNKFDFVLTSLVGVVKNVFVTASFCSTCLLLQDFAIR